MAIYTMTPVIEVDELADELFTQFNVDVREELRNILFNVDYVNDCFKSYCFADDEIYTGKVWQNEEEIRIRNLVNAYLRDILPEHKRVLIDVRW
jgi:hypothetical protein